MDTTRPMPLTQPWSKKFWEGCREGCLLIQRCQDCQNNIFYPRKFCPECWSGNLNWIEAGGRGRIHTFSTAYDMVEPRFWEDLPYTIAYVDLEEGVRMMTRIVDCRPEDIHMDMEVEVVFHKLNDEFHLPYFRPVKG